MRKAFSQTDLASDKKRIDHEVSLVQRQIALAEKSNANLLKDFTNIIVDLNRLLSRQQELYLDFQSLARDESPVIGRSLDEIEKVLNVILSALKVHVRIIQEKVLKPISENATDCRETREKLSQCTDAKKQRNAAVKALSKSKKLGKSDKEQQTSVVMQSTKQLNELTSQMTQFERNKANELKKVLTTYIHSNLAYHVKAVEQYTKAYQVIARMDVEEHVEHFIQSLNYPEKEERANFVRWNSFNSVR